MNELIPLLQQYCQLTNITPILSPDGTIDISLIFTEANRKGHLSTGQLQQFKAMFKER